MQKKEKKKKMKKEENGHFFYNKKGSLELVTYLVGACLYIYPNPNNIHIIIH